MSYLYFEVLRHLFNMAIKDGYLEDNPVRFYVLYFEDGQRRSLTKEEITLLSVIKIKEIAIFMTQSYKVSSLILLSGQALPSIKFPKKYERKVTKHKNIEKIKS